ncbi:MAG: metalloregulator ArsR/SmtB family transcription factor [Lachnospiraceae bacterium]|nr:metalloregulator ArsR/SmtB family transcription factor [Lachnospiraceae bacterium]
MGKKKKQEKEKKRKDKGEKLLKPDKKGKFPKEEKQSRPEKQPKLEKQSKPEQSLQPEKQLRSDMELTAGEVSPEVFRALGDESRMQILELLKDREVCAGDLLQSLNIVQSTLSHHMKILVETGIVRCRKQGKRSCYSIDKDMLRKISAYIMKWS